MLIRTVEDLNQFSRQATVLLRNKEGDGKSLLAGSAGTADAVNLVAHEQIHGAGRMNRDKSSERNDNENDSSSVIGAGFYSSAPSTTTCTKKKQNLRRIPFL